MIETETALQEIARRVALPGHHPDSVPESERESWIRNLADSVSELEAQRLHARRFDRLLEEWTESTELEFSFGTAVTIYWEDPKGQSRSATGGDIGNALKIALSIIRDESKKEKPR